MHPTTVLLLHYMESILWIINIFTYAHPTYYGIAVTTPICWGSWVDGWLNDYRKTKKNKTLWYNQYDSTFFPY